MIGPSPATAPSLGDWDDVPLFMHSLPDEDNPAVAALQSLAYEGTPDEIAQNFKEQGNEYFSGKRYREALGFYTQAIDAKPDETKLLLSLLLNRAATNLQLQNYGSVLRDCAKAIGMDNKSSKAYYRSVQALLALDRLEDAIDCANRCLQFDESNTAVQTLLEQATAKKNKRDQALSQRQSAKQKLADALRARHVRFVDQPTDHFPQFDGDELVFPVFFLYPQYSQSDFIPTFLESTPFSAHLDIMFGDSPDWDQQHQYTAQSLVIYAMTKTRKLLKVGKKMTLKQVLEACKDGIELKEGCLSFVLLPKDTQVEKNWIAEYKNST